MAIDAYTPPGWIDRTLPWERIDGELEEKQDDLIRDARVSAVRLLNAFASSLESALAPPNATLRDVALKFYGLCFALGLNLCDGKSMSEIAESLGFERASVSKVACEFCAANDLPPSFYMKAASAPAAYHKARITAIERANAKLPAVPRKGRRA